MIFTYPPKPCTVAQLAQFWLSFNALNNIGERWVVSDSTLPPAGNFGATVVGGGTHLCPVTCMGATWIIG